MCMSSLLPDGVGRRGHLPPRGSLPLLKEVEMALFHTRRAAKSELVKQESMYMLVTLRSSC